MTTATTTSTLPIPELNENIGKLWGYFNKVLENEPNIEPEKYPTWLQANRENFIKGFVDLINEEDFQALRANKGKFKITNADALSLVLMLEPDSVC
jgi:hypothetical protein